MHLENTRFLISISIFGLSLELLVISNTNILVPSKLIFLGLLSNSQIPFQQTNAEIKLNNRKTLLSLLLNLNTKRLMLLADMLIC